MMFCEKNGSCYETQDEGVLADLVESFSPGTPFSAFLLAAEICICLVFFASIPNTRKDSVFGFLAIIFAPFIVKTTVEVAFFIAIYFYTSSYTFWSWIHDSVVSFCYTSFLFNFEYGMVAYSFQCVRIAIHKKKLSNTSKRVPYLIIFILTIVQSVFFWQLAVLGYVSVLLILLLAPLSVIVTFFAACCCKTDGFSEYEEVRKATSRMLWNVPCLLLTMSDSLTQIALTAMPNSYKYNMFHNKEKLFETLFPACACIMVSMTLPALRRSILPCCYDDSGPQNDQMFLLPRSSLSGSPAPSERASISTVSSNAIVPYPNSATSAPYNSVAPMYPIFSMPPGYQSSFPQGQPMFVPVPMTFYNPSHMAIRHNEMPSVQ